MSKLKGKLSRLKSAGPASRKKKPVESSTETKQDNASHAEKVSDFRSRMKNLGRGRSRKKKPKTVEVQNLAGEIWDSPWGPIRRVVKRYPLTHAHGTVPVGGALQALPKRLRERSRQPRLRRCARTRVLSRHRPFWASPFHQGEIVRSSMSPWEIGQGG